MKILILTAAAALFFLFGCIEKKEDESIYGPRSDRDNVKENDEDAGNESDVEKENDNDIFLHDSDFPAGVDDDSVILQDESGNDEDVQLSDELEYQDSDFVHDSGDKPDFESETDNDPDSDSVSFPDFDMTGLPECGNGLVETGEKCEKNQLEECVLIDSGNYSGGMSTCRTDCSDWITTACIVKSCSEKPDLPDSLFEDTNCDGIDGVISDSVFVDGLIGINTNIGTKDNPVATIEKGLELAYNAGKKNILVAAGTYIENIVLRTGVSIHGGYNGFPDWQRTAQFKTNISGNKIGALGDWVGDLTLSFLIISSSDAIIAGDSSYGFVCRNCQNIVLNNVEIKSGKGSSGQNGNDGIKGLDGQPGKNGNPGCESSGFVTCGSCNAPSGGIGGSSPCGMNGGKGGIPGRSSENGMPGDNGTGSDSNGGSGGIGNNFDDMCLFTPGLDIHGNTGLNGNHGIDGNGGEEYGVFDEDYSPSDGYDGEKGNDGQGGGGGGGGKGGTNYCKSYGSSGGGGGGGGCGGTQGKKGTGGGGSFGLWLYKSNVKLENCKIESQDGGKGGNAGQGAIGGLGGLGGDGGVYGGSGEQDDGGCGGWGGDGGSGGRGGDGGGGGGGPSIPLVLVKSSAEGQFLTTYKSGKGGSGGISNGNYGKPGISVPYIELF